MNELFLGISTSNREKILKLLEPDMLTCPKGAKIMSTIRLNNNIAVVLSGYLRIVKIDKNGGVFSIDELTEGTVFGSKISSLNPSDYDVIAVEDSKVLLIDFDYIVDNSLNFKGYNQFLKNILGIINNKFSSNNERILILTNKTIRNKLLEYFRIMYKKNNSKIIYVYPSFTSLADFLAIDRSAMSRELKCLKNEGLIEIKGKKIKLLYYL